MNSKNIRIMAIIVGVIIPIIVIMISAFFLTRNLQISKESGPSKKVGSGFLTPSQILSSKMQYSQMPNLILSGVSASEPTVCKTITCPAEDKCCGCPEAKNIILKDLTKNSKISNIGSLALLNSDGSAVCHRIANSCDYDCGDWKINAIYNVSGKFYADPPPPGWMLSLDYYFLVNTKSLEGMVPVSSSIGNFLISVRDYFGNLFSSGSYVLQ